MTAIFLRSLGHDDDTVMEMIEGSLKDIDSVGPGISPRRIMQTLGTEWGRDLIHKDIWAECAKQQALKIAHSGRSVVIDDLRFPNEYATLRSIGATLVRINRPNAQATAVTAGYEGQLDGFEFDYVLDNVSTLENFHFNITKMMREI